MNQIEIDQWIYIAPDFTGNRHYILLVFCWSYDELDLKFYLN